MSADLLDMVRSSQLAVELDDGQRGILADLVTHRSLEDAEVLWSYVFAVAARQIVDDNDVKSTIQ